jgi:hypothetical protein
MGAEAIQALIEPYEFVAYQSVPLLFLGAYAAKKYHKSYQIIFDFKLKDTAISRI